MQKKSTLTLAALAVVAMVALVAFFGREQRAATDFGEAGGAWLADLQPALGEVSRVRLQSGAAVSTLVRKDGAWGVDERGGYPVDFSRLGALLRELAEAKKLEQKTSKPEYFARLGLDDIEKPDSKAVLVEIWKGDGQPGWRVLIGNAAEGRGGRYVRLADANETWLVDRSPQALAEPADWLDRRLLGVDFARVARIERTLPAGGGFVAARASPGEPSLTGQDIPKGKRARYETAFDSAARAVLGAEPEDVRKATEAGFDKDGAAVAHNLITTFDGLRLEIDALKGADGNWIRVRAQAVEPLAAAAPVPAADAGGDKAAQDGEGTQAAAPGEDGTETDTDTDTKADKPVAEQVADIGARLDGWAYKVSDYVYGELSKGQAEYIEDDKPAADAPAPAAAGDAGEH